MSQSDLFQESVLLLEEKKGFRVLGSRTVGAVGEEKMRMGAKEGEEERKRGHRAEGEEMRKITLFSIWGGTDQN